MVREDPNLLKLSDGYNSSVFHYLVRERQYALIQNVILVLGADCARTCFTLYDEQDESPLELGLDDPNTLLFLVEVLNIDLSKVKSERLTESLYNVLVAGHVTAAELLVANGANVHGAMITQQTMLMAAVSSQTIEAVNFVLRQKVDLEAGDYYGNRAIHMAAELGNIPIARALIKAGALVNVRNEGKNYPIHLAAKSGKARMIRLLEQSGAKISARSRHHHTALYLACLNRRRRTAKTLLKRGASITAMTDNRETVLHAAAKGGSVKVINLLERHGADFTREDQTGRTPSDIAFLFQHRKAHKALKKRELCVKRERSFSASDGLSTRKRKKRYSPTL